ncbi:MAG TPA: hypothetical protein VFG87_15240 [Amycolatopsis sp.]|jgi:hypothetical protein|nr:hypothetical protein [Amycolatopsis sp.]
MSLIARGDIAGMHGTLTELANATLTQIEAPGPLAGNGDPGTPVAVWTGAAPAFLERQNRDVLSGGAQVKVKMDTLILFDQAGADVAAIVAGADWEATTVVVSDNRLPTPVIRRFTVNGLEHQADGTLDHALLTLNAETTVA